MKIFELVKWLMSQVKRISQLNVKKVIYIVTLLILIVLIASSYHYWENIANDFKSKPGDYLIQLLCMLIPILISLFLFHVENQERKADLELQERRLDRQEENQKNMQDSLDKMTKVLAIQSSQQDEMGKHLVTTATELRRIRLPQAYEFLYENFEDIKKYLNKDVVVQNTMNVLARVNAMQGILSKWKMIDNNEIPINIRQKFLSTKNFFEVYSKLLNSSYFYLVKIEEEVTTSNVFCLTLNKTTLVTDLISEVVDKINSLSKEEQDQLDEDERLFVSIYNSKEKISSEIEKFEIDSETMYNKMS